MYFPVNERKAADAVARLIEKSGADVDYLRIMKLMYLADRVAITTRGIPIVGGHYFSMRKGPAISEVMNFVNRQNVAKWKTLISPRKGNALNLLAKPDYESLSDPEIEILDAVVSEHFGRSTDDLVQWCHQHCAEYKEVSFWARKPIEIEEIMEAENKSPAQIEKIVARANELQELHGIFA